jgi:hypothetical protein
MEITSGIFRDLECVSNKVKKKGGSQYEFKTVHKSGEIRWVE